MEDDLQPPHHPQNRGQSPSKLRRGGTHCPVCLARLPRNAKRTRPMRQCDQCGAHPQPGKTCSRCSGGPVWQSRSGAGCQSCGLHGEPRTVIAGT